MPFSVLLVAYEHKCGGPCLAIVARCRRVSPKLDSREGSFALPKTIPCEKHACTRHSQVLEKPGYG